MILTAIAQDVIDTGSYGLIKPTDQPGEYDFKRESVDIGSEDEEDLTREKKGNGWILFDGFTAGAVVAISKALSPEAREKYNRLPLGKFLNVTWKLIKGK